MKQIPVFFTLFDKYVTYWHKNTDIYLVCCFSLEFNVFAIQIKSSLTQRQLKWIQYLVFLKVFNFINCPNQDIEFISFPYSENEK